MLTVRYGAAAPRFLFLKTEGAVFGATEVVP
jgi:hypothetical protein